MSGHGNHVAGELGRLACANRADNMLTDHDSRIAILEPDVAARQLASAKNQANGYAGLDGTGKVPASLLPATPINNSYTAANQAAMLALSGAVAGDLVWRDDTSTFWQLKQTGYATLANWNQRTAPVPGVTAINGTLTGNVTNVELSTNKGVANGYASLGADGKVPSGQLPSDAGVISHVNEYHEFDIRKYGAVMNTDCTNAFVAALLAGQNKSTPGQYFQTGTTGAFQGNTNVANGGCDIFVPVGTWFTGNLLLSHRAGIGGAGHGSIIKRLAGTSGDWITNRRDGSVHAKYANIHDLALHGNWNAATGHPTGTAVKFAGETGYTSAAYTNPLDEDYDEHHGMWNVYISEVDGDGLRVEGSGEFRGYNIHIRTVSGNGAYLWQDNWLSESSLGHTGKRGLIVAGDDCRINGVKTWYNGELLTSEGQGMYITADSGVLAGCSTQDTWAQGVLFDGAHGFGVAGLMVDSASKSGAGTYAGIDIYNSSWINFGGAVVRNRYRSDGSTGPCRDGVNIAGGSHHLYGDITAAIDADWGVVNRLKSGSVAGTGSVLRVNGVAA